MPKTEKPKIKITGKATASGGGTNKPTLKLNQYGQPVKSTPSKPAAAKKKSPSLASKVASKVVKRAKIVAREVRDIPTAVGAPKRMQVGTKVLKDYDSDTRKPYKYTMPKYKGNASSGIKAQLKEAAAAITAGQKGTSVGHTSASGKKKPPRSR
jgi:hypothetical protein